MLIADVIADIKNLGQKYFSYYVPEQLVPAARTGSRVTVMLGFRKINGYIVALYRSDSVDVQNKYKPLIDVLPEQTFLNEELVQLARWMADTYLCSFSSCLQAIVSPSVSKIGDVAEIMLLAIRHIAQEEELLLKRAPKQYAVWQRLCQYDKPVSRKEFMREFPGGAYALKALQQKGWLTIEHNRLLPDGQTDFGQRSEISRKLTAEQDAVLRTVNASIAGGVRANYLLIGVTGSGKTEVYLQAIAHTISLGKQAIMLVPEIALTPQMIDVFSQRFGGRIAVIHSQLSKGEKRERLKMIIDGRADVVIGTRSAVFAPCPNPGLIIIDEEHEQTYKQEENPRYITHEVARRRADYYNSVLLLGSATPSIESYYYARAGKYQILHLKHRVNNISMPQVRVIDLRMQLGKGNESLISEPLYLAIGDRLRKKQQIILFLNRRGYSSFVSCRQCGAVIKCPHCAISLTLHRKDDLLKCHYCGYSQPIARNCPQCGEDSLQFFGSGTQKLEEVIDGLFPQARVLRMDGDTVRRKGAQELIYKQFKSGEADILIGTQMIAKGFDFSQVTLVGVINADIMLNIPDFRAAERTFQLLTQVAGRAGRGTLPGEVMIQTFNPEHYAVELAAKQDYNSFIYQELKNRQLRQYPPFITLARILVYGANEEMVKGKISAVKFELEKMTEQQTEDLVELLGPTQAPIVKIKDNFRWHIILKGKRLDIHCLLKNIKKSDFKDEIKVNVDLVPLMML